MIVYKHLVVVDVSKWPISGPVCVRFQVLEAWFCVIKPRCSVFLDSQSESYKVGKLEFGQLNERQ